MTKGELRAAISRGYGEMSELTKVKCGGDKCPGVGNRAYRCCDRMHCQMTIDHAYKDWGFRLPTTGHQLPLRSFSLSVGLARCRRSRSKRVRQTRRVRYSAT
jgi:hypothetical protein